MVSYWDNREFFKDKEWQKQRKVLAIIPMISAFCSIIGSNYIIYSLLRPSAGRHGIGRNPKLKITFNRLLLALSISDLLSSGAQFFSTWTYPNDIDPMFPTDKHEWYHAQFPFTAGNKAACSTQGFFIQAGLLSSLFFNAFIAIQYVLTVTFQWREKSMRIAEKFFFIIGIGFPLCTSIFLSIIGGFGPLKEGFCWISVYPFFCDPPHHPECRGETIGVDYNIEAFFTTLDTYRFYMATLWIALALIVDIIAMIILFCTVRMQEVRTARWSDASRQGRNQKRVVKTALLYIGAFLLVWIPPVTALYGDPGFALHLFIAFILPFQGVINALIFSKSIDAFSVIIRYLFCCTCLCKSSRNNNNNNNSSNNINNNNDNNLMNRIKRAFQSTTSSESVRLSSYKSSFINRFSYGIMMSRELKSRSHSLHASEQMSLAGVVNITNPNNINNNSNETTPDDPDDGGSSKYQCAVSLVHSSTLAQQQQHQQQEEEKNDEHIAQTLLSPSSNDIHDQNQHQTASNDNEEKDAVDNSRENNDDNNSSSDSNNNNNDDDDDRSSSGDSSSSYSEDFSSSYSSSMDRSIASTPTFYENSFCNSSLHSTRNPSDNAHGLLIPPPSSLLSPVGSGAVLQQPQAPQAPPPPAAPPSAYKYYYNNHNNSSDHSNDTETEGDNNNNNDIYGDELQKSGH